jgi:hypothetical protein
VTQSERTGRWLRHVNEAVGGALSALMVQLNHQPHTDSNQSAGNCAANQIVMKTDGLRRSSSDNTKHSPKILLMNKAMQTQI